MRPYTILIVDDEAFVVDWLTELLESDSRFEFNILRAYNGIKALEWIERTRIDLLITDIRMPNISGLDLVIKLNQTWPYSKSILLTAYADFDYAKQAISHGVISYILKTADDSNILEEVNKAIALLDRETLQQNLITETQKDLNNSLTQLKHQYFLHWIRGNYLNTHELNQCIQTLRFEQGSACYSLLIGNLGNTSTIEPKSGKVMDTLKLFQAKTITEHYFETYIFHKVAEINQDKIIWILQPDKKTNHNFITLLSGALELSQRSCLDTLGLHISFVISEVTSDASQMPEAYFTGKNLLNTIVNKEDIIMSYHIGQHLITNSFNDNSYSKAVDLPKQSSYLLMKKFLENGNRQEFLSLLNHICDRIGSNINWHNNIILEMYYSTVLTIISYINKKNLTTKIAFKTGLGILFRPWLASSWNEIKEQLYRVCDILFDIQDESRRRNSLNTIEVIKAYITEHITEDISLIDLSDLTGYSTTYLSKFFSDNEGITITDYISNRKIEKIKELMLDSNLNIGDIADAVGFHSRTYFNNYFKRLVGMAPQQYREQLISTSKKYTS